MITSSYVHTLTYLAGKTVLETTSHRRRKIRHLPIVLLILVFVDEGLGAIFSIVIFMFFASCVQISGCFHVKMSTPDA